MLDERWIRNLVLARQLVEQAGAANNGTPVGAMSSVLLADLAVETVIKTGVAFRPPNDYPGDGYLLSAKQRRSGRAGDATFPAMLDATLASWREERNDPTLTAVELGEAWRLHTQRNLVQHDAVVPTDIPRWLARAEGFSRWLVAEFFNLQLEEISRAILLRGSDVRDRVRLAERAAEQGDYRIAMAQLRIAFDQAISSRRTTLPRFAFDSDIERAVKRATGTEHGRQPAHVSSSDLVSVLKDMARRLGDVDETVRSIAIGANPVECEWFLRTAPEPLMAINSPTWFIYDAEPRSRDEYSRAYDFVVSTLLRWQQLPPPRQNQPMRSTGPHPERTDLAEPINPA